MRSTAHRLLCRTACALTGLLLAGAAESQLRSCSRLVVVDADLRSVDGGGVLDVDPGQVVDQNSSLAASGGMNSTLSHVAVGPGREVWITDLDADPAGLGADANGGPGPGALFVLDATGAPLRPLADGTACGSTIVNCGPTGVFVDPVGVAHHAALDLLVVVDPDADPSGLGRDSNGFAGRGALFVVDPVTGRVDLLADGSNYPAGLPPGQPSIFEDPVAIDFARDGTIFVADQLARLQPGAAPGLLFRVDPASGEVAALPMPSNFAGLRDIAVEPSGTLLVLDRLAGTNGTIFRIDPLNPMAPVLGAFTPPELVDPVGIVSTGDGDAYLLDAAADPLGAGRSGAVFRFDPAFNAAALVSSTEDYGFPWSLDLLEPEVVSAITPPSGEQGQSLTLSFDGGTFLDPPVIDLGPDITVDAVRWLSPVLVEADVTIGPLAAAGTRDVRLTNPDFTQAFHCDLFEVTAAPGCAPSGPVGDSLRVSKPAGDERVYLEWNDDADACRAAYRVYRSFTARPSSLPGDFPSDPSFIDLSPEDEDGDDTDADFLAPAYEGENEYFLIVPVGTDLSLGPSGHYP